MKKIVIATALAAATTGRLWAAEPSAPLAIDALAEIPFIAEPVLSPSGKRIAARINNKGKESLAVYDLLAGPDQAPRIIPHQGKLSDYGWAGDDRIVVSTSLFTLLIGSFPLSLTQHSRFELSSGKALAISAGGGFGVNEIIFTDPNGRFVLLSSQKDLTESPSVYRIDLGTGAATEVQRRKADIGSWFVDSAGEIRGGISYDGSNWRVYARDKASGALRKAASGKIDFAKQTAVDSIALHPDADSGVIVTNERTGRFGVYQFDLNAQTIGAPIFEHPEVDVTKPQLSQADGSIEAIHYEDDRPRVRWLVPELERLQAQIDRTFAGKVNRILDFSRDRNTVLIWTGGADDPGTYYIFDRKGRRMSPFATPYEKLNGARLAEVEPIRYAARDGLSIPGYLTLPPGRSPEKLPLIVMPHGGPFVRDGYAFEPLVQLLASRGYAVLQPNFRGSTGYGRDFVEKGYGEWGAKMQDDLDDGVAWLAGQGMIDRGRVCLLGSSYGGYAALWGAIRNPDIYRCAISMAGVTDLPGMLKHDAKFLVAGRYFKSWRKKVEGEQKRDLVGLSPLHQAARLTVPVLIAHGERDTNVPPEQSRKLVAALKARGVAVQSAFYPTAGHGFETSADAADYMNRVETFLEVHNPADGQARNGPRDAQLVAGTIEATQLLAQSRKAPKRSAIDIAYTVTADGRVTGCAVEGSSGIEAIDAHACSLAEQQFQYRPALNAAGQRQPARLRHRVSLAKDAKDKAPPPKP